MKVIKELKAWAIVEKEYDDSIFDILPGHNGDGAEGYFLYATKKDALKSKCIKPQHIIRVNIIII